MLTSVSIAKLVMRSYVFEKDAYRIFLVGAYQATRCGSPA